MDRYDELLERTKEKADRYFYLEKLVTSPEIIADSRYRRILLAEQEGLSDVVKTRQALIACLAEYEGCTDGLRSAQEDMKALWQEECERLFGERERLYRALNEACLGKEGDAVITFLPNGNKAKAFCAMLQRAFTLLCEKENHACRQEENTLTAQGAYARLQKENGTHKCIQNGETATVAVVVLPKRKKEPVKIDERDIRVDLFHSGGAGGQNINKVETAIRITHFPTGIVVTCQDERSQLQNKNKAFSALQKKLEALQEKEEKAERERTEKSCRDHVVRTYDFDKGTVTDYDRKKYPLSELLEGNFPY